VEESSTVPVNKLMPAAFEGNINLVKYKAKKERVMVASLLLLFNPLIPELNPICYLLALLAQDFLHVSRIRVKSLTLRLLMSCIYIWSTYS
jgi:transposase